MLCVRRRSKLKKNINLSRDASALKMIDIFSRSGIDVISSCAFGLKVNSFLLKLEWIIFPILFKIDKLNSSRRDTTLASDVKKN